MTAREPPPTWAPVTVKNIVTEGEHFSPTWLDWFVGIKNTQETTTETVTTLETTVTTIETTVDGITGIPQLIKNASYTLTIDEAHGHLYKSNTSAYTWTIPANSAVAFDIGTAITFVNGGSAGNITIAITTDTLYLVGTGGTASKTLLPYGMATALKVAATTWMINGTGLS